MVHENQRFYLVKQEQVPETEFRGQPKSKSKVALGDAFGFHPNSYLRELERKFDIYIKLWIIH